MKYVDLHCDALTCGGVATVTEKTLQKGGCGLQVFAAFIEGRERRFARATELCDKFAELCKTSDFSPVTNFSHVQTGKINALLSVEEGGAIEGDIQKLEALYARGVRLMTLTWNYPNEIGFPNFPDCEGLKSGEISPFSREKERGLTEFGRETAERMIGLGMLIDVSHGSDKLVEDVAEICSKWSVPFLASHSGAAAICPWARNLEDRQIRLIAESGGVVGLDFCTDFTSPDASSEGQRQALLAHARHLIEIGGEDVLSIGSDFDGIPPNAYLPDPSHMPKFLEELEKNFGSRIAEKIACGNALRVLKEVL